MTPTRFPSILLTLATAVFAVAAVAADNYSIGKRQDHCILFCAKPYAEGVICVMRGIRRLCGIGLG